MAYAIYDADFTGDIISGSFYFLIGKHKVAHNIGKCFVDSGDEACYFIQDVVNSFDVGLEYEGAKFIELV